MQGRVSPVLGRAVQTLRAQVYTFLPGLATQRKTWPYTGKKASAGCCSSSCAGHVERCGWADGVGRVFLHPPLPSPPFSRCPGDNYGVGFVASVADFSGLQRGWFCVPQKPGRGWVGSQGVPRWGWRSLHACVGTVQNHCLPGG